MSRKIYTGGALAVNKVVTVTVGGTLSGETFQIKVGGVVIASFTDADTVIASTVAGLVSAWNTSAHPWAIQITAADASPDITLTADIAGVDFAVTLNAPGGATTFTQSTTVANGGTNDINSGNNWYDVATGTWGAKPVASDDVEISPNAPNICWGLDQSAIVLDSFRTHAQWLKKIGLDWAAFATSADGDTTISSVAEYRDTHLQIKVDGDIILGEHSAASSPTGSGRVNIDLLSQAGTQVDVQFCAATSSEPGRASVRLKGGTTTTDVHVRDNAKNVGLANDRPGDVATFGDIINQGKCYIGAGVTINDKYEQYGVNAEGELNAAAALPACNAYGGTLVIEGDFAVTILNIDGSAAVFANNKLAGAGDELGTVNLDSGTLDGNQSARARDWNTVNRRQGATLNYDDAVVTIATQIQKGPPPGK